MRLILSGALVIMVYGTGVGLAQDIDVVDTSVLAGASSNSVSRGSARPE